MFVGAFNGQRSRNGDFYEKFLPVLVAFLWVGKCDLMTKEGWIRV